MGDSNSRSGENLRPKPNPLSHSTSILQTNLQNILGAKFLRIILECQAHTFINGTTKNGCEQNSVFEIHQWATGDASVV